MIANRPTGALEVFCARRGSAAAADDVVHRGRDLSDARQEGLAAADGPSRGWIDLRMEKVTRC